MSKVEQALSRFSQGFNCSQSVFSTFAPHFALDRETALKIAGGFGGGMGRIGEVCGAVAGALMVIGLKHGATDPDDAQAKETTYELVRQFVEEFRARNGSITCRDLLGQDIATPEGRQAAREKDLFNIRCTQYVRDAAEILDEMLNLADEE
jgi:C_GCAxxG_C_C family probable redox protein